MKVYVIILHYGNAKNTLACLATVLKMNFKNISLQVLLIDNGTKTAFDIKESRVKLISNVKNLGYGKGVNLGLREGLKDKKADYFLILNNDTEVPVSLLNILLKTEADIIAPLIKFRWNNVWKYDFGGKINWWTGRTEHIEKNSKLKTQNSKAQKVQESIDYVSGCCMLVKREVFEKIGLFDERYFFYFEDVDFCYRATKMGFKIKVNPQTFIFHKLGGSIGRWSIKAIWYNLYGNYLFIKKHFTGVKKLSAFSYLMLLSIKILWNRLWGR